jgi:type II secretory pathway component PulJ
VLIYRHGHDSINSVKAGNHHAKNLLPRRHTAQPHELWLVSLIAVTVVTYSLFASLDRVIKPSQRELQGLPLIEPLSRMVQLIQQHRGYSAALLGGVEGVKDKRAAIENQVESTFHSTKATLPPDLTSNPSFQRLRQEIRQEWAQLRGQGLDWTMAENFAAHTHLIRQIQSFETFAAGA